MLYYCFTTALLLLYYCFTAGHLRALTYHTRATCKRKRGEGRRRRRGGAARGGVHREVGGGRRRGWGGKRRRRKGVPTVYSSQVLADFIRPTVAYALWAAGYGGYAWAICGAGTLSLLALLVQKVQILTPAACVAQHQRHALYSVYCSVYLLYWYKSTNTDAAAGCAAPAPFCSASTVIQILTHVLY
jgi:hypothetical protein